MKKLLALMLGVIMVATLVAPSFQVAAQDDPGTIVDVASTATVDVNGTPEGFVTLVTALSLTGLDVVLADPAGEFTVFAPVDSAFGLIPAEVLDYALFDTELLTAILTYHVVPGIVTSEDVVAAAEANGGVFEATTVNGGNIVIHVDEMGVRVNSANVIATDIMASNGVIHVIDAIIYPEVTLPEVNPADVSGAIVTAGSSTVGPLSIAIANRWQADGGVDVPSIDIIGSGAGFERFCVNAETDISNASSPIKQEQIDACLANGRNPLEFRVGTDALAVVVSTENDFLTGLSLEQLAQIFSGAVTNWNEVDAMYPDAAIELYSPGTDSGTFSYFVEEVLDEDETLIINANPQFSEDDNVLVEGVSGSPYAIGYFGYAYYTQNRDILKILDIDGVTATDATVENNSYPLARPLFIYSDAGIMTSKPQVAAFINYYLTHVNEEITAVGYFPPSSDALNSSRILWLAATFQ